MFTRLLAFLDLDDAGRGLALPKVAGVAVCAAALVHAFRGQLTANHVTLVVVALAALFGRNVFKLFLGRATFSAAGTAASTRTETDTETRTITARRDEAAGVEPS